MPAEEIAVFWTALEIIIALNIGVLIGAFWASPLR
jgi:hypothetical protein